MMNFPSFTFPIVSVIFSIVVLLVLWKLLRSMEMHLDILMYLKKQMDDIKRTNDRLGDRLRADRPKNRAIDLDAVLNSAENPKPQKSESNA